MGSEMCIRDRRYSHEGTERKKERKKREGFIMAKPKPHKDLKDPRENRRDHRRRRS